MALAAVIIISVVSTTFTAARLFTRGKVMGKLMLDDYLILTAVVSNPYRISPCTTTIFEFACLK